MKNEDCMTKFCMLRHRTRDTRVNLDETEPDAQILHTRHGAHDDVVDHGAHEDVVEREHLDTRKKKD